MSNAYIFGHFNLWDSITISHSGCTEIFYKTSIPTPSNPDRCRLDAVVHHNIRAEREPLPDDSIVYLFGTITSRPNQPPVIEALNIAGCNTDEIDGPDCLLYPRLCIFAEPSAPIQSDVDGRRFFRIQCTTEVGDKVLLSNYMLYLPSIPEWDSFTLDETDGYIHFLGYLNGDITEEGILGLCFDNLTCNIFPLKYRYVNCLPPYKSKEMDDNFHKLDPVPGRRIAEYLGYVPEDSIQGGSSGE